MVKILWDLWEAQMSIRLFILMSVFGLSVYADAPNQYVELYRLRVELAEANSERQQALAELARSKYERSSYLLSRQAEAKEDNEIKYADWKSAEADAKYYNKKIAEAKTFLAIVEGLAAGGRTKIPICTSEME